MTIIGLLIILVLIGLVLWLVTQIPMDPTLARIIRMIGIVVAVGVVIYWLLGIAGINPGIRFR